MNSKWLFFAALWIATLAAAYYVGSSSTDSVAPSSAAAPQTFAQAQQADGQTATSAAEKIEDAAEDFLAEDERAATERGEPGGFDSLTNGDFSRQAWMKATLEAMSFDSDELQSALDTALLLPASRQRDRLVFELLERWGSLDPQNALAFAEGISSMEMRNRGIGQVLEGWAAADPVSALNWLNQNGGEFTARIYGDYLEDIVEGYAQNNAVSAMQYVQGLPEGTVADRRIKHGAMREVINAMVEQDQINAALDMTMAMEDGRMRNEALEEIVDEWAERDPLAAKAYIESMSDDPAYGEMQRSLLSEWAEDDPEAAAEWLSSLDPETTDQARLATSLIANWTRYDMEAAANWLNSLPQTPELDRAVGMYSMRAAQDDPAAALTWANSVSNQEQRDRLERMILPMLREQDTDAFEAYLAASDYSDDKKQQYRELELREGRGWRRWR